ncbi:MAG: ATP synthase F1 subunit epsilon [Erysipelotrichaceae bacterium]|jgi:F-type H+-transporting ATPase subunit epsilon|nr:ATP synthase F1 subunit epsilon [Erysipelotrichaceae bacterium]
MFNVKIVTPEAPVRSFESEQINIVTPNGEMGILSNHMPLVTMLNISIMSSILNGNRERYSIAGGVLFFKNNEATILSDAVEHEGDIDLARAEHAKQRAEERLRSKDPEIDAKRAQIALLKALNRIDIGK